MSTFWNFMNIVTMWVKCIQISTKHVGCWLTNSWKHLLIRQIFGGKLLFFFSVKPMPAFYIYSVVNLVHTIYIPGGKLWPRWLLHISLRRSQCKFSYFRSLYWIFSWSGIIMYCKKPIHAARTPWNLRVACLRSCLSLWKQLARFFVSSVMPVQVQSPLHQLFAHLQSSCILTCKR